MNKWEVHMNKYLAGVALAALATGAHAGGLDRSGQDVSVLFQDGNYAELSIGKVTPSISGTFTHPIAGALPSGEMANDYFQWGAAIKMQMNDQLSFALITDQPYGADIAYSQAGYPLAGTKAKLDSRGITALGRYELGNGLSVHGGLSMVNVNADITMVSPAGAYSASFARSSGVGYVVGAAYERPEIALRAALTYRSEIDMSHDVSIPGVPVTLESKYTLPQSVNLDFQTGIMADTLLMANVRWVDWSALDVNGPNPVNPSAPLDLVDYTSDSVSYSIGIGRKFTDQLSGSFMVGYEKATNEAASNLAPTDGKLSFTVGAKYAISDSSAISAGISYVKLGDATTETIGSSFKDNSAIGFGIKYSMNF